MKTQLIVKNFLVILTLSFFTIISQSISVNALSAENESYVPKSLYERVQLTNTFAQTLAPPNEQQTKEFSKNCESTEECIEANPIIMWLNYIINIVAGIIGVGAILMVIWGGIQYTTARDNAQAVQAAKDKILNVVIGLAAFIFLYAFLQWLVPGGVFA